MSEEGYIPTEPGIRLFFRRAGSGRRTLIVLNGFYLSSDFEYLAENRSAIFLDLRNRGRSDNLTQEPQLARGVLNDVDDIEAARRHFDAEQVDLLAHSYAAKTAILYAIRHGAHVGRVVQIGPPPPCEGTPYPARLTCTDAVLKAFLHEVQQLQKERSNLDARTFCKRFWTILKPLYVVDPKNASRIQWDRCGFATEMNFGEYWMRYLLPSIRAASPTSAEIEGVRSPVLVVHGKKDRSAPYGGGREWAMRLPDARLLTVEETAHAPWIEAPHRVKRSIRTFLDGDWPDGAEGVDAL